VSYRTLDVTYKKSERVNYLAIVSREGMSIL